MEEFPWFFKIANVDIYKNLSGVKNMESILNLYKEVMQRKSEENLNLTCKQLEKKYGFDLCKIDDINMYEFENWLIRKDDTKFELIDKYKNIKNQKELDIVMKNERCLKDLAKYNMYSKKENAQDGLYVGYPFITGKLESELIVNSPVALFPVKIHIEGEKIYLIHDSNMCAMLNKRLLLELGKITDIDMCKIQIEYENMTPYFINDAIELLKHSNIDVRFANVDFEKFEDYKHDIEFKGLSIKRYVVLNKFDDVNYIYEDYIRLDNIGVNKFLKELNPVNTKKTENLICNETEMFNILPVDNSQEMAIRAVNEFKNILIYGPPGTGKSQTVVNIVACAMARNKKVLVVSSKGSGVDIIYNRLLKINSKVMKIIDSNKDKNFFYNKIKSQIASINTVDCDADLQIKLKTNQIEDDFQKLNKLYQSIYRKRDTGLNLHQMYLKTKGKILQNDDRYKDFLEFKTRNKLLGYRYDDIKNTVNGLCESKIVSYFNYNQKLQKCPMLKDANVDINTEDIDKICDVLKRAKNINSDICSNKEKDIFEEIVMAIGKYGIDIDGNIMSLASKLNNKLNNKLLEDINDGKWWKVSYWINYSKNKEIEKSNKNEYDKKQQQLYKDMIVIKDKAVTILESLKILKQVFKSDFYYDSVMSDFLNLKNIKFHIENILKMLEYIKLNKEEIEIMNGFNLLERDILYTCYDENVSNILKKMNNVLEFCLVEEILKIEQKENEALNSMDSYESIVGNINDNIEQKYELTVEYIKNKCDIKTIKALDESYGELFLGEINKDGDVCSISQFMKKYYECILNIFPCFILTPQIASEILPLKSNIFDLVIFDEASQMLLENSIPSIFRAKQIIVSGDDKQVGINQDDILSFAKENYEKIHLKHHYRCESEYLINFSNYAFYNGELKMIQGARRKNGEKPVIQRIKTRGKWIDDVNEEEVCEVVNQVKKIIKERTCAESIGIITFTKQQEEAIKHALDEMAKEDIVFKAQYEYELSRVENSEDMSLFIKSIEDVQGDERDVIILSTTYAKNLNGEVIPHFEALNVSHGINLLNMAISRAKKKMYVVTSIEPEELNIDKVVNRAPKLFKNYLQYVRAVSQEDIADADKILNRVFGKKIGKKTSDESDNEFKKMVSKELSKISYEVYTKNFGNIDEIDIAIYNRQKSKYVLGIKCSSNNESTIIKDICMQKYLKSRGWNLTYIWSRNWWKNSNGEINRIEKILEKFN